MANTTLRAFIAFLMVEFLLLSSSSAAKTAPSPDEKKSIEFWSDFFARPNTPVYYFVIIVWIAVSFSKKDFQKLNGSLLHLTTKHLSKTEVINKRIVSQKNFKNKK